MKSNTIGGLAISTLLIAAPLSVASAADMPLKAPPPPPAPVYGWSACYIGGNTGGAWARKTTALTSFDGDPADYIPTGSTSANGWAYGGQIGCDYQFNTTWVVGIRGMWDGSTMKGSNQWPSPAVPEQFNNYKIDSFGTVVGKLGYLVAPTVELYVLGGVAWVHDSLNWTYTPIGEFANGSDARTGYDVGVGLSWMFAPNWDVWIEYDYMGFGTKNLDLAGVGVDAGAYFTANVQQSVEKVLLGIDYRITWTSAPAAAPLITK